MTVTGCVPQGDPQHQAGRRIWRHHADLKIKVKPPLLALSGHGEGGPWLDCREHEEGGGGQGPLLALIGHVGAQDTSPLCTQKRTNLVVAILTKR